MRRHTRSQARVTTSTPPPSSIEVKASAPKLRLPLPQLAVVSEEDELYLYYSSTPGQRPDYGGKFTFKPLAVHASRLEVVQLPVEVLRVPHGSVVAGDIVHVVYYIEESGDSFGMSADWHILGTYVADDMARMKGINYKNNYKSDYFTHLVGVYVFSTTVLSGSPRNTIVEL